MRLAPAIAARGLGASWRAVQRKLDVNFNSYNLYDYLI